MSCKELPEILKRNSHNAMMRMVFYGLLMEKESLNLSSWVLFCFPRQTSQGLSSLQKGKLILPFSPERGLSW